MVPVLLDLVEKAPSTSDIVSKTLKTFHAYLIIPYHHYTPNNDDRVATLPTASQMKATHQPSQNRRDKDDHKNDLNLWNGAALLVADCMGTGVSYKPANSNFAGVNYLGINPVVSANFWILFL